MSEVHLLILRVLFPLAHVAMEPDIEELVLIWGPLLGSTLVDIRGPLFGCAFVLVVQVGLKGHLRTDTQLSFQSSKTSHQIIPTSSSRNMTNKNANGFLGF